MRRATRLLSKVIDRGTATRSADDIAEALDSRGISLNVTVARHLFSLICTCLSDDFADVMALLADLVQRPTLPKRSSQRGKPSFRVASSASGTTAAERGAPAVP